MGLIARQLEAAGLPTLCMSSALDITESVNPPRAAFLDFPLGHTTGKPDDPELQRSVVAEALEAFLSLTPARRIKHLPFRWSSDEAWKKHSFAPGDQRLPRHDTPQYQTEEDRQRAEAATAH